MNQSTTTRSWIRGALLALTALLPLASTGCTGDATSAEPTEQSRAALGIVGTGSGGSTGGILNGGWAPIPVYAPTAFQPTNTTTSSVTLSWNEHGGNGQTILYRQLYDLAGNATGTPVAIHTWTSLPAGPVTYTDSNPSRIGVVNAALVGIGGGITGLQAPIQPDHMVGYQIVEVANGYSDCESVPGGYTCASAAIDAYIPGAVPYGASRVQLRFHVAQATAHTGSFHVRAELTAWTPTWLDSTQNDFVAGSNITYDLRTDYISGRSDIMFVDLWTPDPDGICIDDLQLRVDDTTTFHESFATCQWVRNGSEELFIPFTTLRSSAEWQAYAPHHYLPGPPPVTFVGFNGEGLTSYLDSVVGDQLKNSIPTPASGFDARLGAPTTITRTDATHLHVQQHLVNLHVEWDDIDFGTVSADPSYDLVIHHADSTCAGWCVDVENVSGNSSYAGWVDYILDVLTVGVIPLVKHEVNVTLENALSKFTSSLPNPDGFGYCFVPATFKTGDPRPLVQFFDEGVATDFDAGSLTICSP